MNPVCPYCDRSSELTTGRLLYPNKPALARNKYYICKPCGAWVGCHGTTTKPMGRLANKELRNAKRRAHAAFDPLWQELAHHTRIHKSDARKHAYLWLAAELGLHPDDCHIGMFDLALCNRVIEACKRKGKL